MNYRNIIILILLIIALLGCDRRSARLSLLIGDPSIEGFVSLEPDAVTMYASPADKKAGRIECRIYEDEYPVFINMFKVLDNARINEVYREKRQSRFTADFIDEIKSMTEKNKPMPENSDLPLAGIRIAIDPGHSAGSFNEAIMESKYMWLFARNGAQIKFYEAQLNLETARILKEMLEKDGAIVMQTRDSGRQAYPVPFNIWAVRNFSQAVDEKMRDNHISPALAHRLLSGIGNEAKLKFFNSEIEMPYRAKIINAFHPHVTVLVHYDARDEETAFRSKYLRIKDIFEDPYAQCTQKLKDISEVLKSVSETKRDYCTVFVPGCFLSNELNTIESRIEFLRLIISPDLDNSIVYSKYVLENFKDYLDLPGARESFSASISVSSFRPGLYARNFRMTRLVRGTLCLGEPLQQNNIAEAAGLSQIATGKTPERVKLVARAYYDAIRKYVKMHIAREKEKKGAS